MPKTPLRALLRIAWTNRLSEWWRYARSLTRNDADAEDLVDEAVTRTLLTDPSLANEREVHLYVIAAIRNTWFKWDRVRRRRAEILAELGPRPEELASTVLQDLINAEHRGHLDEALGSALKKMKPKIREAIGLYLVEGPGLKFREVAEAQGVSTTTAHERVQKALRVMAGELKEFDR